jgi:hypothetical protein
VKLVILKAYYLDKLLEKVTHQRVTKDFKEDKTLVDVSLHWRNYRKKLRVYFKHHDKECVPIEGGITMLSKLRKRISKVSSLKELCFRPQTWRKELSDDIVSQMPSETTNNHTNCKTKVAIYYLFNVMIVKPQ